MPVRYTQNIAIELAISNGADGVLVGVDFPLGTTFSQATPFGVRCKVASTLPFAAYVRSRLCTTQHPIGFSVPTRFPVGTVPVLSFQQTNIRSEMKENMALSTGSGISIRQLPLVPSFAVIAYRVQGITAKSLVAYPFMKGSPIVPPFAAHYVALSRVQSFETLFLCEEITEEYNKHFTLPSHLLREQQRLEQLTLERYNEFVKAKYKNQRIRFLSVQENAFQILFHPKYIGMYIKQQRNLLFEGTQVNHPVSVDIN